MSPVQGRPAVGLTQDEAAARLAEGGRNELLAPRAPGVLAIVGRQLTDTVIVVLLVAAALTTAVGDWPDTAVILAVVVLNSALGALQEVRSGHALAALADLTAPRATVVRDGQPRDIDARDVVAFDLIRLSAGDVVAADGYLAMAESLQVDESMLTGESVPAAKGVSDLVYAGTVVTRGRAEAVVTAISEATALGRIARSLRDGPSVQTPVQRQLTVLGRRLAVGVSLAAVAVAVLNLAAGRGTETSLVLAISLAVAAIPESLPAVVALSLALAARRMTDRGVLARRLAAVEALGSVTVIAADKTGTLTEGRMALAEVWTPTGTADDAHDLVQAAALCNDAYANGQPGERDDPTEVALVDAATDLGIDVQALRRRYPRLAEEPFEASTARMTTTHARADGGSFVICKGSPEALLGDNPEAQAATDRFALRGLRVLAVSRGEPDRLLLLCLVALADPIRRDAPGMIDAFRRAGSGRS